MTIRCNTYKVTDVYLNGKPLNKVYCNGVLVYSVITCWQSAEVYMSTVEDRVAIRVNDIDNMLSGYSGSDFTVLYKLYEDGEYVCIYADVEEGEWNEVKASPGSGSGNITFRTDYTPKYGSTYSAEVKVLTNGSYQGWSGTAPGSVVKPYTYVPKPVVRSRIYNGSTQYAFDASEYYTLSGGRVDAGQGTTTAWLKEAYAWSDGSTARYYSASFTIAKATIYESDFFTGQQGTYTGDLIAPYIISVSKKYTVTGVFQQTNAGSYSYTVTPNSNCQWDDGTTSAKTFTWSIGPATQSTPTVEFATLERNKNIVVKIGRSPSKCIVTGRLRRNSKASTDGAVDTDFTLVFDGSTKTYDLGIKPGSSYTYFGFRITKIVSTYPSTNTPNWVTWSGSVGTGWKHLAK